MPMLYAFRNVDDVACLEMNGWFAPFLVDAFSAHANEDLVCSVVNVPIVTATRFEGDVGIALHRFLASGKILWLDRGEVAVPCKILCVGIVRIALGP